MAVVNQQILGINAKIVEAIFQAKALTPGENGPDDASHITCGFKQSLPPSPTLYSMHMNTCINEDIMFMAKLNQGKNSTQNLAFITLFAYDSKPGKTHTHLSFGWAQMLNGKQEMI